MRPISPACGLIWRRKAAASRLQIASAVLILFLYTALNWAMKPGAPLLRSVRLLDQLRERIRYKHYSLRTEESYLYWVRCFVRWHKLRHPRDMGAPEIEGFLAMLATERHVSAATHNQALSALLFLYREVLDIDVPWLADINRPIVAQAHSLRFDAVRGGGRAGPVGARHRVARPAPLWHRHAPDGGPAPSHQGRGFRPPRDRGARGQGRQGPRGDAAAQPSKAT